MPTNSILRAAFFLVIILTQLLFAQTRKKNIAVIDLNSRGGLSKAEIGTLTDRLRSVLVRTNAFTVIDRGLMEDILSEQGFQMSGCTSTDCAVEAGKILGVEQMVSGTLGKLGRLYTIDIILLDVSTSHIIKSLTRDYSGEIEGLIGQMKSIADELAGAETPGRSSYTRSAVKSGMDLQTKPSGAAVYIDNKYLGVTPIKKDDMSAGQHTLKIEKEGYKRIEGKFTVVEGTVKNFEHSLIKMYTLSISSNPSQANVYVNKDMVGQTPYSFEFEAKSKVDLQLQKTNYKTFKKSLVVKKDQDYNFTLEYTDAYKKQLARSGDSKPGTPLVKKDDGSGSSKWLWIGGGAIVAAAAVYFLLPKDEGGGSTGFPYPPDRP